MKQHLGQVESDSVGESFKAIAEFTSVKKIKFYKYHGYTLVSG